MRVGHSAPRQRQRPLEGSDLGKKAEVLILKAKQRVHRRLAIALCVKLQNLVAKRSAFLLAIDARQHAAKGVVEVGAVVAKVQLVRRIRAPREGSAAAPQRRCRQSARPS